MNRVIRPFSSGGFNQHPRKSVTATKKRKAKKRKKKKKERKESGGEKTVILRMNIIEPWLFRFYSMNSNLSSHLPKRLIHYFSYFKGKKIKAERLNAHPEERDPGFMCRWSSLILVSFKTCPQFTCCHSKNNLSHFISLILPVRSFLS